MVYILCSAFLFRFFLLLFSFCFLGSKCFKNCRFGIFVLEYQIATWRSIPPHSRAERAHPSCSHPGGWWLKVRNNKRDISSNLRHPSHCLAIKILKPACEAYLSSPAATEGLTFGLHTGPLETQINRLARRINCNTRHHCISSYGTLLMDNILGPSTGLHNAL